MLPLIITVSVVDHAIFDILVDDGSACNIPYVETFVKLGLHQQDIDPSDDKSLLVFNDSTTHPCGVADLSLSLKEGEGERKVNLLLVLYKSAFRDILKISFLVALDVVVSLVHLKVTYHSDTENSFFLVSNLREARRIHNTILRNLVITTTMSKNPWMSRYG